MRVLLRDITGAKILAGAVSGRKVLADLLAQTAIESSAPKLIFLDFGGIEVATASFLRESVLAFRNIIRNRRSNFYPVVANVSEEVRDELKELLELCGDVLAICNLGREGRVTEAMTLGQMDPKQRMTFELVQLRRETDASELMRDFGESEGVTRTTAWNNRLSSLAALGLIIEVSQGRSKRYRSLFQEV